MSRNLVEKDGTFELDGLDLGLDCVQVESE